MSPKNKPDSVVIEVHRDKSTPAMAQALSSVDRISPSSLNFTLDQVALIKRQIAIGATDDELAVFLYHCQKTGLDPLARQIYFQKRGGKPVYITAIDGFRLTAARTGQHAGTDDAVFDNEDKPKKATTTVYRMINGQRFPYTATARWDEYCPGPGQDHMWKKMPCSQLAKCSEALALRKAFPAELGGTYVKEEMDQATSDNNRIVPLQPTAEDGNIEPTGYRISFGKFKQRSLEEVGPDELRGYVDYLENKAKKDGKQITGVVADFIERASEYVASFENDAFDDEIEKL
jgi:phage recombination protein Bet